jgi:hypothetical protein
MRLYDCKVLLAGSRDNEVRKTKITAAEIMVLQALHGSDSVLEINPVAQDKRSSTDERRHLFRTYVGEDDMDGNLGGFAKTRADILNKLFGPSHVPLPTELPKAEAFAEPEDDKPAVRRKVVAGKAEDVAEALA